MKVTFRVNGKQTSVDVPADMPLLWVLRDVLDLKGTKFGCGIAECGACPVPMRSCILQASDVQNAEVTTIEGLSPDGTHPLQRAWEEVDVPQCGYCQAGQIMSAAALLAKKPRPTDADIDEAMAGNICRCATYIRIREAIHRAAAASTTPANRQPGRKPRRRQADAAANRSAVTASDVPAEVAELEEVR
jgi:isoquinoline 1-oxidoreductase alpha subunit